MLYVCKLGPIRTMEGSSVAFFGFTEAGIVPPVIGKLADKEGLTGLLQYVHGESELCCEPNLAKAGQRLGFKSAPVPQWVAPARAGLAFGLSLGALGEDRGIPAVVDGFILAAKRFWGAQPWKQWTGADVIEIVATGSVAHTFEASIMGAGGETYGIALYPRKGTLARISALMEAGRETRDVDSFAVTFDREPQWAADAINDGFGLPVVPGPMNIVGGRPKPLTTKMLVLLSAVLEAAAALSPETPSADAQIAHGDLAITVQITAPA